MFLDRLTLHSAPAVSYELGYCSYIGKYTYIFRGVLIEGEGTW